MTDTPDPPGKEDARPPGTVVPWPEKLEDLPEITGDAQLVKNTWEGLDAWTYAFLWHCVVSF